MVMRAMRKNQRTIMAIMAILIAFGLVGSSIAYYLLSGPGVSSGGTRGSNLQYYETEIKTLQEQIKKNPSDVSLQANLGHVYFEYAMALRQEDKGKEALEQFKRAIQTYEEVLRRQKDDKAVLGNLATCYYYTGRVDDAIKTVEKVLQLDPNFSPARLNYGIYLGEGKGDYKAAIAELKKIPAGDPNYQQAQSLISKFSAAASAASGNTSSSSQGTQGSEKK